MNETTTPMNIIQHHSPIDFYSLFKNQGNLCAGRDFNECLRIFGETDEFHSFLGSAEWKDRVINALYNSIASDEAAEVINQAKSVLIFILSSLECDRSLNMDEMKKLPEFISRLSQDCEVVWNIADDETLGNVVKTILLVNITKPNGDENQI